MAAWQYGIKKNGNMVHLKATTSLRLNFLPEWCLTSLKVTWSSWNVQRKRNGDGNVCFGQVLLRSVILSLGDYFQNLSNFAQLYKTVQSGSIGKSNMYMRHNRNGLWRLFCAGALYVSLDLCLLVIAFRIIPCFHNCIKQFRLVQLENPKCKMFICNKKETDSDGGVCFAQVLYTSP